MVLLRVTQSFSPLRYVLVLRFLYYSNPHVISNILACGYEEDTIILDRVALSCIIAVHHTLYASLL